MSVWIAQREGRAKNGWDRTDPALLKMFSLAYKGEADPLNSMLKNSKIVPVAVSYELDPCATAKARELYIIDMAGSYAKSAEEDVESIITGLVGQKGRVHLHIGEVITGEFDSPQALAERIDQGVVGGLRVFPTQAEAATMIEGGVIEEAHVAEKHQAMQIFRSEFARVPVEEKPFWLNQYANVVRNRAECGVTNQKVRDTSVALHPA